MEIEVPKVDEGLLRRGAGVARRRARRGDADLRQARAPERVRSASWTRPSRRTPAIPRTPSTATARPPRRWRSTSSRRRSSASASRSTRSARTAAARTRSGRSRSRPACCRAPTAPRCSRAARRRRCRSPSLGTLKEEMRLDTLGLETKKYYFHHYNFPPFSVGEAGFMRGPKRRDIGHGALAERALVGDGAVDRGVPVHDSRRVGHPRVQRLVVDGVGLRLVAVADGRGRAAQAAGRGHRDGAHQGGRRVRRAHRHRRRRGSPRRHGLQGRRHVGGHHRPADGHQDHGRDVRHPARRADARR